MVRFGDPFEVFRITSRGTVILCWFPEKHVVWKPGLKLELRRENDVILHSTIHGWDCPRNLNHPIHVGFVVDDFEPRMLLPGDQIWIEIVCTVKLGVVNRFFPITNRGVVVACPLPNVDPAIKTGSNIELRRNGIPIFKSTVGWVDVTRRLQGPQEIGVLINYLEKDSVLEGDEIWVSIPVQP